MDIQCSQHLCGIACFSPFECPSQPWGTSIYHTYKSVFLMCLFCSTVSVSCLHTSTMLFWYSFLIRLELRKYENSNFVLFKVMFCCSAALEISYKSRWMDGFLQKMLLGFRRGCTVSVSFLGSVTSRQFWVFHPWTWDVCIFVSNCFQSCLQFTVYSSSVLRLRSCQTVLSFSVLLEMELFLHFLVDI